MNSWYIPFIRHYQRATPALVPGEGDQQIRYFPVEGGSIRGCISRTEEKSARRPMIFLSGWGTSPELFRDVFTVIHGKCDYYYLERARAEAVIKSADLAKWKAAVRSIGDYDALDIISAIPGQGLPRRFDDFEVRLGD
jgi:hypothetical protein